MHSIRFDAFNIVPGLAFTLPNANDIYIAEKVSRNHYTELVSIWARRAIDPSPELDTAFGFHFCDKVQLVGIVVNPSDRDDNNFGQPV